MGLTQLKWKINMIADCLFNCKFVNTTLESSPLLEIICSNTHIILLYTILSYLVSQQDRILESIGERNEDWVENPRLEQGEEENLEWSGTLSPSISYLWPFRIENFIYRVSHGRCNLTNITNITYIYTIHQLFASWKGSNVSPSDRYRSFVINYLFISFILCVILLDIFDYFSC